MVANGKKRKWKIALGVALVLALLVFIFIKSIPAIICSINPGELVFDLTAATTNMPPGLVENKDATLNFSISRARDGAYLVRAHGRVFDFHYTANLDARLEWRFWGVSAKGGFTLNFNGSPFSIDGEYEWSSSGEWKASVRMDKTHITQEEYILSTLLSRIELKGVENLAFEGDCEFSLQAGLSSGAKAPKWQAKTRFSSFDVTFCASGKEVAIEGMSFAPGASGLLDHVDIAPIFFHAKKIDGAGFTLEKAFASVRATETAFLVTEAGAGFCGGEVRLYSFFLDPARLNAGLTLFVDEVETGELFSHFKDFRGSATGRLYGKIPLQINNGREVRLKNAYLYSSPGEKGNLRIEDSEPVVRNLALAGLDEETRRNLSLALADLEYSVLRLTLKPEDDGKMALGLKIEGVATHAGVTVPVNFEVVFHGDIEQLINTGIGTFSNIKKR